MEEPTILETFVTNIGTMLTGMIDWMTDIFAFFTSEAVLPWILIGTVVSLISFGGLFVKRLMWGA